MLPCIVFLVYFKGNLMSYVGLLYEAELGRQASNSFAALGPQMRALNISQNECLSEIGTQMVF